MYTNVCMDKLKLTDKESKAIRYIRNSLAHSGQTPTVREIMIHLGYRSPRSAAVIIDQLINKGILCRKPNGNFQIIKNIEDAESSAQTIDVPLVGTIACGFPILAEENIETMIPVTTKLAKPDGRYFLLKVKGDSMNEKGINDGDLVLVRQQATAQNGDIVVALIDNEATIKEFHKSDNTIILKPRSTNKSHNPIVLTRDFKIQGIVITPISNL